MTPAGETGENRSPLGPALAEARAGRPNSRAIWSAHLLSLAGSAAFWAYLCRHLWFFDDEWDFLLTRGLGYPPGNSRSIWYPHFEHWSTIPVLFWRTLYSLFHLSSYWPYLALLFISTVGVMHLLWRLCLRNGVSPWVATGAVAMLGLLGPGAEDLGWAFQVGFVGSVAFGLIALLLVDRPSPSILSTVAASVATLASLMCSSTGDAMVIAVAVVVVGRASAGQAHVREKLSRIAAVLGVPVLSYAIWWSFVGRLGFEEAGGRLGLGTFTGLPTYAWTGLSTALGRCFNFASGGSAILLSLGAWSLWRLRRLYGQSPAVAGMSAAALAFYLLVGLGRDTAGASGSTAPRYIYVAIALLLPSIALALSSLCEMVPAAASHLSRRFPEEPCAGTRASSAVGGSRKEGRARATLPAVLAQVGAVALLLGTAAGDARAAVTWAAARSSLIGGIETEVRATSALLASGARAVGASREAPVPYSPDLTLAVLAQLGRSGSLGRAPLPSGALAQARAALQVGLTTAPLYRGRFALVSDEAVAPVGLGPECKTFAPGAAERSPSGGREGRFASVQRAEVVLSVPLSPSPSRGRSGLSPGRARSGPSPTPGRAANGASALVIVPPRTVQSPAGIYAALQPRATVSSAVGRSLGPGSSGTSANQGVPLQLPASGAAYLDDDYPSAMLVLRWETGTPLTICGLASR